MRVSPRLPHRPLARRRGARRHADSRLGHDLLPAGADAAADRGGARLLVHLRDGRIFRGPADGRAAVADGRRPDRSLWRPSGDAVPARSPARPALSASRWRAIRSPISAVWLLLGRHLGVALRSGLRDARTHLRRQGALPDHRADARGRLRLDGELARDLALQSARLEGRRICSMRRCSRWSRRRCAFALPRDARRSRRAPAVGAPPAPATRPAAAPLRAGGRGVRILRVRPVRLSAHLLGDLPARRDRCGSSSSIGDAVRPVAGGGASASSSSPHVHPLWIARFAVGLLVASFALLALFGLDAGRGRVRGHVRHRQRVDHHCARRGAARAVRRPAMATSSAHRRPALIVTAVAPVVVAFVAERASDAIALGVAAACAAIALVCFALIRR